MDLLSLTAEYLVRGFGDSDGSTYISTNWPSEELTYNIDRQTKLPADLPTNLWTNLLVEFEPTNLFTYLATDLPAEVPTDRPAHRQTYLPSYWLTNLPITNQPANWPTYLSTVRQTYQPPCLSLPAYFLVLSDEYPISFSYFNNGDLCVI